VRETIDSAKKGANRTVESMRDLSQHASNAIKEGAESIGERIKEGAESVKQRVVGGAESFKEGAESIGERMKEGAESVKQRVVGGAESLKEGAEKVSENVREKVHRRANMSGGNIGQYEQLADDVCPADDLYEQPPLMESFKTGMRNLPQRIKQKLGRSVDLQGGPSSHELVGGEHGDELMRLVDSAHKSFLKHDYQGAIKSLDCALELAPNDVDLMAERARANMFLGKHKMALEDLDNVISIDPSLTYALVDRAVARLQLRDVRGALDDLTMADLLQPDDFSIIALRSLTHLVNFQLGGAIREGWRALRMAPYSSTRELMAFFSTSQLLMAFVLTSIFLFFGGRLALSMSKFMLRKMKSGGSIRRGSVGGEAKKGQQQQDERVYNLRGGEVHAAPLH
jgi:tetratricopeptide (TPR) repeat protein